MFNWKFLQIITVITLTGYLLSCGSSKTAQKTRDGAATGAALGALAGVVFGSGNIMDDAADAAVRGAAAGAAVGLISGKIEEGNEQEIQQARRAELAKQSQDARKAIEELNRIFGRDNVESYYALIACQHQRAYALADAGETGADANHRVTAIWLKAMIAIDSRDIERANKEFDRLIVMEPDIDTRQQASLETDKLILEMRSERREMGLSGCP